MLDKDKTEPEPDLGKRISGGPPLPPEDRHYPWWGDGVWYMQKRRKIIMTDEHQGKQETFIIVEKKEQEISLKEFLIAITPKLQKMCNDEGFVCDCESIIVRAEFNPEKGIWKYGARCTGHKKV